MHITPHHHKARNKGITNNNLIVNKAQSDILPIMSSITFRINNHQLSTENTSYSRKKESQMIAKGKQESSIIHEYICNVLA